MARQKNGVNKSEEIRQLLKANPNLGTKEGVAALAEKGIEVSENLFYYVKGKIQGKKGRKKKAQKMVATVANSTGTAQKDALATILKVKGLANEVGGLKKLKALIDAMHA
jgi:hypothetical protein